MIARTKKQAAKTAAPKDEDEAGSGDEGYDALMNKNYGSLPKEKDIMAGTYRLKVRGNKGRGPTDKASANTTFFLSVVEPTMIDIDEEQVAELENDDGEPYDFSVNKATIMFWLGEPSDWAKLDSFVVATGIDTEDDDVKELSRGEVLKLTKGKVFIGYLKYENYTDRQGNPTKKLVCTSFAKDE